MHTSRHPWLMSIQAEELYRNEPRGCDRAASAHGRSWGAVDSASSSDGVRVALATVTGIDRARRGRGFAPLRALANVVPRHRVNGVNTTYDVPPAARASTPTRPCAPIRVRPNVTPAGYKLRRQLLVSTTPGWTLPKKWLNYSNERESLCQSWVDH